MTMIWASLSLATGLALVHLSVWPSANRNRAVGIFLVYMGAGCTAASAITPFFAG